MKPLKRLYPFLLPLFLTIIPSIILFFESKALSEKEKIDQRARRLEGISSFRERFQEMTSFEFWVEETSRRLDVALHRLPEGVFQTPSDLQKEILPALLRVLPKGIPQPKIWAFYLNETGPTSNVCLLSENGLENTFQAFFKSLFRLINENYFGVSDSIKSFVTSEKIRALFGTGSSLELFTPSFRGKPFSVVFQRNMRTAVWNLLLKDGKPFAGYMLLFPASPKQDELALKATFNNWPSSFKRLGIWPGFYSIPGSASENSTAEIKLHPCADRIETRIIASKLAKSLFILPATDSETLGNTRFLSVPTNDRENNQNLNSDWTSLPINIGQFFESEKWTIYPTPLNPILGKIGLLIERSRPKKSNLLLSFYSLYKMVLVLIWVPFLIYRGLGGTRPWLGIKSILALWFIALIATPLTMAFCTQERLKSARSTTMKTAVQKALTELGNKIESGISELDTKAWRYCHDLTSSSELPDALEKSRRNPAFKDEIMEKILQGFRKIGLTPVLIDIIGPDGFEILWNDFSLQAELVNKVAEFLCSLVAEIFGKEIPGWKTSSIAKMHKFSNLIPNDWASNLPQTANILHNYFMGNKRTTRFCNRLFKKDKLVGFANFIWNQNEAQRKYLKEAIPTTYLEISKDSRTTVNLKDFLIEGSFSQLSPYLGALEKDAEGYKIIAEAGSRDAVLEAQKRLNIRSNVVAHVDRSEVIIKSRKMPGMAFVAGVFMEPLISALERKRNQSIFALLFISIFALAGAYSLSSWMGEPIRQMVFALNRAARGDYQSRITQKRGDEIESAGKTLDKLTAILKEREMMGRFVSNQVLETIISGGATLKWKPRLIEAVALVSDIRDFTPLSEANSPEAMFSLINKHIQVMTEVIKRHGGDIERFIGDAIQAIFLSNHSSGIDSVKRAIAASLEMTHEMKKINEERTKQDLFNYKIGIGLEKGALVAGMIGDEKVKLDMVFLGTPMTMAAELENISKVGKASRIVCSGAFRSDSKEVVSFLPIYDNRFGTTWEISDYDALIASSCQENDSGKNIKVIPSPKNTSNSQFGVSVSKKQINHSLGKGMALFFLWTLPIIFMWSLFDSMKRDAVKNQSSKFNSILSDEMKQLSKCIDPQFQIAEFLQFRMKEATENLKEPHNDISAFENKMGELVKLFPKMSWYCFKNPFKKVVFFPASFQYAMLDLAEVFFGIFCKPFGGSFKEGVYLPTFCSPLSYDWFSFGGKDRGLDIEEAKIFFEILMTSFFTRSKLQSVYEKHDFTKWNNFIQDGRFDQFSFEALAFPFATQIFDKPGYFTWFPIDYFFVSPKDKDKIPNPFWKKFFTKEIRCFVESGMFMFFESSDFSLKSGMKCFVENLAKRGFLAGISVKTEKGFISETNSEIQNLKTIRDFLLKEKPYFPEKETKSFYQSVACINTDNAFRVFLALPKRTDDGKFSNLSVLISIFSAIWLFIGFYFTVRVGVFGYHSGISLKSQLFSVIFLILAQILLFNIFSEELVYHENCDIQIERLKTRLVENLSGIDWAREIQLSGFCQILNKLFDSKSFLKELESFSKASLVKVKRKSWKMVQDLLKTSLKNGNCLTHLQLNGRNLFSLEHPNGLIDFSKKIWMLNFQLSDSQFLENYSKDYFPPLLTQSKSKKMVNSSIIEEIRTTSLLVTPAEVIARMLNSPHSLSRVLLAGERESYVYHRLLLRKKEPFFFATCSFSADSLDRDIMQYSFQNANSEIGFENRKNPIWKYVFPFSVWINNKSEPDFRLIPMYSFNDFERALCSKRADLSELPVFRTVGTEENQSLEVFKTGHFMTDRILSGSAPLGYFLSLQELAMKYRYLLSWFVFLLGGFLSIKIARSFLKPLEELEISAERIMSEDFSTRLPEYGQIEFKDLAQSFNRMAVGVYERDRLKRFVSEAVQLAAKDELQETLAVKGECIEVTVLFSTLSNFKKQIGLVDPEILIRRLNKFLSLMSRIVRKNGGEIEKFIGDKILAVFHPRKLGSLELTTLAAIKTAQQMEDEMAKLHDSFYGALGIGIVTGPVIAGIMGASTMRSEYTVLGDTVNLASRLCDLAILLDSDGKPINRSGDGRGGIVVEKATFEALPKDNERLWKRFIFPDLPPIKGKTRDVKAYFESAESSHPLKI
ncbi:MAG: HAMP domain-containing protein [Candidatus Riflebacteria bacterium]|nr:HAMP domain-containing protein [Candidatus Riflebacteria bacterium]